ncbi:MAG: hypothetical protein AB7F86_14500 [Bdellovibrionales bacterium]
MLASLLACQSGVKRDQAVVPRFKGKAGDVNLTRYFSTSQTKTYAGEQLVKDRTESVEFDVENRVLDVDPKGNIRYEARTTEKDGMVELHDLAFPELGEKIEFLVTPMAQVLRAGSFPPESLFFVPSLPIPKEPVRIGDSWPLEYTWASAHGGIPLRLQIVAILKDLKRCEEKDLCAKIEISGSVQLVAPPTANARFTSRLSGTMLFNLDRGDVIWSLTHGEENMISEQERVNVRSCMMGVMQVKGQMKAEPTCDP